MPRADFGLSDEINSMNDGKTEDGLDVLLHEVQDVSHEDDFKNFHDTVVVGKAQFGEWQPVFEDDQDRVFGNVEVEGVFIEFFFPVGCSFLWFFQERNAKGQLHKKALK